METGNIFSTLKRVFRKSGPQAQLREFLTQSAEHPDNLRLKLQLGKTYFKIKDLENGIAIYQDVAERYLDEEFYLKAISVYKEILKYSPGSIEFNEKLGDLFHQLEMKSDAVQQYRIAQHAFRSQRRPEDLLRVAQKIVEVDPQHYPHRLRLAEIYFNQGKEEESMQEYEKVAQQLKAQSENLDVLADIYEKILLKRPNDLELIYEVCGFYLKLQEPEKVIRRLERRKLHETEQFKPIYKSARELKSELVKKQKEAVKAAAAEKNKKPAS